MDFYNGAKIKESLSAQQIHRRVVELGAEITSYYRDITEPLVIVSVLKGSVIFLADLCREIRLPVELEFMGVSSYGEATVSSGAVQITLDLTRPIENRHILFIEDIVDTGLTAKYLLDNFSSRRPASIKLCSLLEKPSKNLHHITADFLGFQIADEFVVGYGLDYAGIHRNLPFIGIMQ